MSANESSPSPGTEFARRGVWIALIVLLLAVSIVAASTMHWLSKSPSAQVRRQPEKRAAYSVTIREPVGSPTVQAGTKDLIACNTCHLNSSPKHDFRLGKQLTSFHQHIAGKHGELTCASCHNPSDGYQSLRLADGRSVPYTQVMQLCAQCHGPQYRDYIHGAHGGMTGYWDLNKGPRVRNNCIHCHDPHAPRYPTVQPARGPGDVKGASHD